MRYLSTLIVCTVISVTTIWSQTTTDRYRQAEQLLSFNLKKKLYNQYLNAQWTDNNNLWFKTVTRKGTEYLFVKSRTGKKNQLFNQQLLAKKLSKELNKDITPFALGISDVKYSEKSKALSFKKDEYNWVFDIKKGKLSKEDKIEKSNPLKSTSPDKQYTVEVKNHNLILTNNNTKQTKDLTNNGTTTYGYGESLSWYFVKNESKNTPDKFDIEVYWTNNSKKIIVPRYNREHARKLYMYRSLPDDGTRASILSYERPIAGDSLVTTVDYVIIDINTGNITKVDLKPNAAFLGTYIYTTKDNNNKAYRVQFNRGYQSRDLIEIDLETGKTRTIYTESSETYVDVYNEYLYILADEDAFLWQSEEDGWNHIYKRSLKDGSLIKQITEGEYVVRSVVDVDVKKNQILFMASGKESGDPYFKYLYSTTLNGETAKLLTPESADHNISLSPSKEYFIDNYSRIDLPNIAKLRSGKKSGYSKVILKEDIEDLKQMGWKPAQPFKLKARDGKTDIYGVIFLPTNFDPNKSYPVIDGTYSGPQTIRSPKTFRRAVLNNDLALAELGFIVVNIDGLGSAFRSKKFHDFSYRNLGDIGAPDHIKAIKELAEKHSYIDATRVGIYGHSAGGYDAVRAMLMHPDFYKAGVSSAGNHDHRIAKAWWPELYMGYPAGEHYDDQSNFTHADKLKGKLLLIHGREDQNVNPAASMRMADELIKQNKDFDLIMIPGRDHSTVYYDKYLIRKRWDFFVKHLAGEDIPDEYKIK
ncbi:MAG: prolyl oligopeptidase family serine peptidase [Bacteroidales bacterium]|jgi:dipeptidyl aminopeptidase/acylaminoacyl peptidase|nr:prolyl oligopeptidase family serine peptidase [Bacteroidales bacterium]